VRHGQHHPSPTSLSSTDLRSESTLFAYQLAVSVRRMGRVLDIYALRSLVAVADCGGFHRAATTLGVSQSAVSRHIRRLEKVTGRPVVERQGRGTAFTVSVTSEGKVVEHGPVAEVFTHPRGPYTRELIDAIPGRPSGAARAA
jgi:molybdate transport repressor ModE-like protein